MTRALTGGGVLLRRITAWWAADGVQSGIARVIGTLLGVLAGGGMLMAAPVLWWPLAIAWLIACWCAAPAVDEAEESEDGDDEDEPDLDAFVETLHTLMPGRTDRIHTAQIAEHLKTSPAAVRDLLQAADIPTGAVRVKGRGSSTGVKKEDLPPLGSHSPSPVVGVVAAGQRDNSNFDNGREGFVTLPDPDGNPQRHKIHWVGADRQAS